MRFVEDAFGLSRQRACRLAGISRSAMAYQPIRTNDDELRARILELARERPRFGYRRIHVLLRREGWTGNRKRTYRIYREEQLWVRRRKRKRVAAAPREAVPVPEQPNVRWSMDFVADTLGDGRTFRVLNIVDDFSREAVAPEVGKSIPGSRVVRVPGDPGDRAPFMRPPDLT